MDILDVLWPSIIRGLLGLPEGSLGAGVGMGGLGGGGGGGFGAPPVAYGDYAAPEQMDALLAHLMSMDANRFGAPPAATDAVTQLPRRVVDDASEAAGECAVCRDGYSVGETTVTMPCDHVFHEDCLKPWLESVRLSFLSLLIMMMRGDVVWRCR